MYKFLMLRTHTKYNGGYFQVLTARIILDMDSANERLRYIVTSSLIGCAHTQNDPRWPENDIHVRTWVNDVLKQKKLSLMNENN